MGFGAPRVIFGVPRWGSETLRAILGAPTAIFGAPRGCLGVPQDLRFWEHLWCQKQHFLGTHKRGFGFLVFGVLLGWGGPNFGHPGSFYGFTEALLGFPDVSHFGVPRISGFGAPGGFCGVKPSIFLGAQRRGFGFLVFGVVLGWGGPNFGAPRAIFGVPSCVPFWGPQDLRFWGTKGGFVVSNPAFFWGPEMQVWVSCFWGDFRVGESQFLGTQSHFWGTQGHFWGSQRNLVLGSPGFQVLGAPGGFCGVKPSIF